GSSTVSVPTTNDTIFEQTETFTLNGNVTSGNTTNVNPVGTGTITDNDAALLATDDSYNVECSKFSLLGNILSNDIVNGTIATTSTVGGLTPNVTLTIISGLNPFINIDSLGNISVLDNIPFGTYPIQYQICELGNILNCVTANVTITVEDTTQPVVTNVPEAISYQCIDEVPVAGNLTAIDNCAGPLTAIGVDTTDNTDPCNIIITRTWTFSDGTNSTQVSQTITVHDTTAPVFIGNLPDNDEVECSDAIPVATVQALDNCSATPINATYTDSVLVPNTSGDCNIKGTIDRVWRATDACGNFVEYTQTFTIVDTTKPTVDASFQTTIEVPCDAIPTVITPIFSDNCSTTVNTISFTEVPGDTSSDGKYTITRTWVVSDGCNEETFVQLVNVTITDYSQEIVVPMDCNLENIDIKLYDKIKELYPAMTIETGGEWTDESGLLGDSFDATLGTFNPYQVPVGDYTIKYEVTTNPDCPKSVLIDLRVDNDCSVDDCQTLNIHNAISVNNDGDNEQFIIDNITTECYKNNTIEIYNRWGVLVFDADNYDNETNVFKGVSGGRATIKKSEELPTGTYFYILKHKNIDGNSYTRQGYLYLTR
ncbi:MAG: gliding motility-associated C-terminal domain-containing protein, partial [Cyclobacteriaceae bacterium]|nr:gliding motility-associated C-terminal domain-containing protein [Cyclobacteriaceae bacterium]